jgi:hypothetical protein
MDEKSNTDERLIEEIRGFRQDMRTSVRNALWVFAGSVVLVCLFFGRPLPKIEKEYLAYAGYGLALVLGLYLIGLMFQAFFNARIRRRQQRETIAILSGRTAAASRRNP